MQHSEKIEQILLSMGQGELEISSQLLDSALLSEPKNIELLSLKAEVFCRRGQVDPGFTLFHNRLKDTPDLQDTKAIEKLAQSYVPSLPLAKDIISSTCQAELIDGAKHQVIEALYSAMQGDSQGELLQYAARVSNLHRYEWRYANRLVEACQWRVALEILEKAYHEERSSQISARTLAELLSIAERHDDACQVMETELGKDPEQPECMRKLLKFLQRSNRFDACAKTMFKALERWPSDWMLVMRLNRLPLKADARSACYAIITDVESDDPRFKFHKAIAALFEGEVEHAVCLLKSDFPGGLSDIAKGIERLLTSRPAHFWAHAPRFGEDDTLDVQIVHKQGADTVIVVPTSVTFGMLPVKILDAVLAQHNCSVIYLKDFNKRAYTRGVRSFGASIEDSVKSLADIFTALGSSRKVFLGCSSGGFAAHRLAAISNANVALSLAGPVDLKSYYQGTKPAVWNEEFLIQQILMADSHLDYDNSNLLKLADNTKFFQYLGGDWARDVEQATKLKNIPNVEVVSLEGADHLVINHMIATGMFDELIAGLTA